MSARATRASRRARARRRTTCRARRRPARSAGARRTSSRRPGPRPRRHGCVAALAVPGRDAVAPPELARDAPRLGCSPSSPCRPSSTARREAPVPPVTHGLEAPRRPCPSRPQTTARTRAARLDALAAVAVRHRVRVLVGLLDQLTLSHHRRRRSRAR